VQWLWDKLEGRVGALGDDIGRFITKGSLMKYFLKLFAKNPDHGFSRNAAQHSGVERVSPFADVSGKMRNALLAGITAIAPVSALAGTIMDDHVTRLQTEGYDTVEIKTGPSQTKIEAIRGLRKLEVIYDTRSGKVLKREVEQVDWSDDIRPGVRVRSRDRDFLDSDDLYDD